MNLCDLMASRIRQRILIALSKVEHMHMMEFKHALNVPYNELNVHLAIFEKEGIVLNVYQNVPKHPKSRILCLKSENVRTQKLLAALDRLKEDGDTDAVIGKSSNLKIKS